MQDFCEKIFPAPKIRKVAFLQNDENINSKATNKNSAYFNLTGNGTS